MKYAVSYARVSTPEQKRGFSLDAQVRTLSNYAATKRFKIIREFKYSESAKSQGRKHFNAMLDFLRANPEIRVVLVEKTDRLARNLNDYVLVESLVEELGLEIHLVKEGQVLRREARSQDRLVQGIFAVLARNYIQNMQEEILKGQLVKAEKGQYPGRALFGYFHDRQTRTIVPHPDHADVVRIAFQLHATGAYSLKALRAAIIAKTGQRISKSHLGRILTSRFYLGEFMWLGKQYKGSHSPLVDPVTFERVQSVVSGRSKPKPRRHEFPFSGLLSCVSCGCTITAEKHKGKYVYYRCSFGKGRHTFPYMREEQVAELLGNILESIGIPFGLAHAIASASQRDQEANQKANRLEEAKLRQRLNTLQTKREKAFDDKQEGHIDEEFWRSRDKAWKLEQEQVRFALTQIPNRVQPSARLSEGRILELAMRARELYSQRSDMEKADLLKRVVLSCKTDGKMLQPIYREPFSSIMSAFRDDTELGDRVPAQNTMVCAAGMSHFK
jgi:site-specific DNA recombinase